MQMEETVESKEKKKVGAVHFVIKTLQGAC